MKEKLMLFGVLLALSSTAYALFPEGKKVCSGIPAEGIFEDCETLGGGAGTEPVEVDPRADRERRLELIEDEINNEVKKHEKEEKEESEDTSDLEIKPLPVDPPKDESEEIKECMEKHTDKSREINC